ncbi:MAG: cobalt-precorrin-5B (C(1))-methyltransferase [Deltaproteobacteria bacterium]|nr:cobalt-precorrin-5B (C(1))-methyltransferase [Deltaproteobacteria bacterium]
METKTKPALRQGFTTGSAAAGAAKAAAIALFKGKRLNDVHVRLPRGGSLVIPIKAVEAHKDRAFATVVKDAGDDPDATDGAEIIACIESVKGKPKTPLITIKGGEGVGTVTRPGLKVAVGRSAINPVPLKMIRYSVAEAIDKVSPKPRLVVTISVPEGKRLALKTLNPRLGIIGGISILGTTGIVHPLSLSAYRHSISLAMDVAIASGLKEIILSTGRSSERVVEALLGLPGPAFILTGDHMGFALKEAAKRNGIKKITIAGQFAKFTKLARGHFETHCLDSSMDLDFITEMSRQNKVRPMTLKKLSSANTAREMFFILEENGGKGVFKRVSWLVRKNSAGFFKDKRLVRSVLVGYGEDIAASSPRL